MVNVLFKHQIDLLDTWKLYSQKALRKLFTLEQNLSEQLIYNENAEEAKIIDPTTCFLVKFNIQNWRAAR